jgi:hypothetical protein
MGRARTYVVGGCLLAVLAGCARTWFAEREPWRGEAEVACLKSGAVKEGPSVAILKPIDGPGICGAKFPLRVAALGEPAVQGFADEPMRPPGAIQGMPLDPPAAYPAPAYPPPAASYPAYQERGPYTPVQSYLPPRSYEPAYPPAQSYQPSYPPPASAPPGQPLSIVPPGAYGAAASGPPAAYPQQRAPLRQPAEVVPLGASSGAAALTAGPAAVTPAATLACPLVSTLDRFVGESVQPAAAYWFGAPVVEIKQISAYSCRGMNGNPNAHISEHAFGNALDIAAFVLADGRKITVKDGWHGAPEEQGFLHDVQRAACSMFTTVLAPGSNAYHYDHMHVDLMRRTSRRAICEPTPISGEVAAARAGGRNRARPGEPPYYTGSVDGRSRPAGRNPLAYGDDGLVRAIPGED